MFGERGPRESRRNLGYTPARGPRHPVSTVRAELQHRIRGRAAVWGVRAEWWSAPKVGGGKATRVAKCATPKQREDQIFAGARARARLRTTLCCGESLTK